jgi:hypothetical protein
MKRLGILLVAACWGWPQLAVAQEQPSIDAFLGSWKGSRIISAPETLELDALHLDIKVDEVGFHIVCLDLSIDGQNGRRSERIEASFLPTDRPGVYEYAPESGSLLTRMFASPATGNPLVGETLLWARIEDSTLAVYSMNIDKDGGLDLDHYSWTRTESGMSLTFSQRTENLGVETVIEAELALKEGGQ